MSFYYLLLIPLALIGAGALWLHWEFRHMK